MSPLRQKIKSLIPPKLQFRFINAKHLFTRFKQTHYSQNGEDILLDSLFPINYKGFYVDVGAHHPYRISNTYLLYKSGWTGINIDANPETIKMFKRARKRDINLNIGVSDSDNTLTYHRFSDPAVNTFSETEANKWQDKKWIKYLGTTEVKTTTLANILSNNIPKDRSIDVLSIDVEGLDFEVLQSNDWNQFRPKVVIVEAHDFSLINMDENPLYKYLRQNEYKLLYVLRFSLLFIHNKAELNY